MTPLPEVPPLSSWGTKSLTCELLGDISDEIRHIWGGMALDSWGHFGSKLFLFAVSPLFCLSKMFSEHLLGAAPGRGPGRQQGTALESLSWSCRT